MRSRPAAKASAYPQSRVPSPRASPRASASAVRGELASLREREKVRRDQTREGRRPPTLVELHRSLHKEPPKGSLARPPLDLPPWQRHQLTAAENILTAHRERAGGRGNGKRRKHRQTFVKEDPNEEELRRLRQIERERRRRQEAAYRQQDQARAVTQKKPGIDLVGLYENPHRQPPPGSLARPALPPPIWELVGLRQMESFLQRKL
ncbi:unnamed protein product [Vitrella brassicaformis CCMP3155]|uniref:Uncharacterized protein n=1 Tax=Vitrella brassicaformis (strain CCMP3155) TaxID=1169540 RepID=A0A0G4EQW1_VITBC|nr:unnamed protein product [Vitrella brassicaformis CCMP3155]|eukprot:CEM00628.1 unnamed protein product [Vitrella brassicaformis CCMP3155]